jgi:hypothetical protein
LTTVTLASALAAFAVPASAKVTHPYTGLSFGPSGAGGSASFKALRGIAVDEPTGDIFAYDSGAEAIYKFDSSGEPVDFSSTGTNEIEGVAGCGGCMSESQLAVAPAGAAGGTAGDIYVTGFGHGVAIYSPAGDKLGELNPENACGVAVDPAGHVFVGSYPSKIREYTPTANPVVESDPVVSSAASLPQICNVAVDGLGNIYSATFNGEQVAKLEGIAALTAFSVAPGAPIVADPVANDVYLDRGSEFAQYDSTASLVSLSGAGQLVGSQAIAVNGKTEVVYAGNGGSGKIDVFGPLVPLFEATAEPPSGLAGSEATLAATVNPAGQTVTECRFEYGTSESYGQTVPCVGAIAADEADHPVSAPISGLTPATAYHFRVTVVSASSGTHHSADLEFETAGPAIEAQVATGVGASEATLTARIDPRGALTTYHFEYLTEAQYQSEGGFASPQTIRTPIPDGPVGEDEEGHGVSASIVALQPATIYYFRVVATSTASGNPTVFGVPRTLLTRGGESPLGGECSNETLRAENGSLALPDCRAYEQVTPIFKNGGFSQGDEFAFDGPRVSQMTLGSIGSTENTGVVGSVYEYTRAESGWATTARTPPASRFQAISLFGEPLFDSETGALLQGLRTALQPEDAEVFYREDTGGGFTEIGPASPPGSWVGQIGAEQASIPEVNVAAVTPDISHVVYTRSSPIFFGQNNYLWPFDQTAEGGYRSLYEYVGAHNAHPLLVGVTGGQGSNQLVGGCGVDLGSLGSEDGYNALSADGSTVFFTVRGEDFGGPCASPAGAPKATELYVRVDGETPSAHTIALSEPSPSDCSSCQTGQPQYAAFQGASEDGSKVFFLTEQELLPGNPGRNLYEYDFAAPAGQKVTAVSHLAAGGVAGVRGVVRVSEDGSHVYFVASAALVGEANSVGDTAQPGQPNLYVYDTIAGTTKFVATLSSSDNELWKERDVGRPAEATPNGRFLLFASAGDLTPDDTSGVSQLFHYDSVTGQLVRVSIGQNGFNDNGNTANDPVTVPVRFGSFFGSAQASPQTMMSSDGAYVFFESTAGLTPKALDHAPISNSTNLAENIYEWHNGGIALLSDGRDRAVWPNSGGHGTRESAVRLLGATADGSDVFFSTASPLVPSDSDSNVDIYDARTQGGFAVPAASACTGDSCQGPTSAGPGVMSPTSMQFSGGNNLVPALPVVPSAAKKPTKAKLLARALKACRKKHGRHSRIACEHRAKKQYASRQPGKKPVAQRKPSGRKG